MKKRQEKGGFSSVKITDKARDILFEMLYRMHSNVLKEVLSSKEVKKEWRKRHPYSCIIKVSFPPSCFPMRFTGESDPHVDANEKVLQA